MFEVLTRVGKNKGQENVAEGKRLKETPNRWNTLSGKEQDPKCIQGIMNQFSQYGGYNMVIDCSKNKPKLAWSKTKTGTSYAGGGSSNTKSPWSKTKTGTSYAGRSFSEDGLEEREFSFEFDIDEREQLDLDVEGRELDIVDGLDDLE
ncbi:hypothetical protein DFP72DRAFT_844642 [Ephemerocybe angulata]|uniref:Uncharacterized protein n=1 Tax=Ephemerocybe angulata TaxID=980116 RepID=A0A8H6I4M6_9AGAR|nr:hypothetical protein DFP72DRAFT_844642 [Tulosesus angulatus]